jgi:FXSXX-COOH protein
MVPTEELRSAVLSSVADLRDIPLAELSALGSGMLGSAMGRALPGVAADLTPVAAFQSSI